MKIFIDTANIDRIKEINDWGILDGVTTNPSLIAKEGKDLKTIVTEISQIVDGPISAEVMSMDAEGMVAEGLELAKIHPNINIKLPMCIESLKATKVLASKGIKVNVTLIFLAFPISNLTSSSKRTGMSARPSLMYTGPSKSAMARVAAYASYASAGEMTVMLGMARMIAISSNA